MTLNFYNVPQVLEDYEPLKRKGLFQLFGLHLSISSTTSLRLCTTSETTSSDTLDSSLILRQDLMFGRSWNQPYECTG